MTRLRADLCLLLVAAIWGAAFVAQKTAMDSMGPFGYTGVRFLLSMLVILPFVIREWKKSPPIDFKSGIKTIPVSLAFVAGLITQQFGLIDGTVTNAGFISALYVLFTPFFAWVLFRHMPSLLIWPACALSVAGLWFLNGGSFAALTRGDYWFLVCAIMWGAHVALTGWFLTNVPRPLFMAFTQYGASVVVGLVGALLFEHLTWSSIETAAIPILYGGIISGGIAYTLQIVAQQYAPPSHAAIILSAESIFAALTGVWLMNEGFTEAKIIGCSLILLAILSIEAQAFFRTKA